MGDVPTRPSHGEGRYEIRVRGHLHPRWTAWFDSFSLSPAEDGITVLVGRTDQAGLHGVLRALADLGLPLVSVSPADPEEPGAAPSTRSTKEQP